MPQNCSHFITLLPHHSQLSPPPISRLPSAPILRITFPFLPFSRILSWFLPNWQLIKMPCSSLPFSSRLSPTTTIIVRLPNPHSQCQWHNDMIIITTDNPHTSIGMITIFMVIIIIIISTTSPWSSWWLSDYLHSLWQWQRERDSDPRQRLVADYLKSPHAGRSKLSSWSWWRLTIDIWWLRWSWLWWWSVFHTMVDVSLLGSAVFPFWFEEIFGWFFVAKEVLCIPHICHRHGTTGGACVNFFCPV